MKYLFISILVISYTVSVKSNFCYWNTGCLYKYFATKTPYNFVRGDFRDNVIKLTDCEPVTIWGIFRHGKTYADSNGAVNMKNILPLREQVISNCKSGKCSLCAQDVDNLLNWSDNEVFNKPNHLTNEGYQDSVGFGQRLKETFPELLAQWTEDDYIFRPANEKFIQDSLKGFIKGLGYKDAFIQNSPKNDFDFINPSTNCKKYQEAFKNNSAIYQEPEKYRSTAEYLALKDRLTRRLGLEHILTDDNITAIYDLCRYTSSGIDFKFSPWCALFTTEDLKVLEYIGDLENYYKNGYGTPINPMFGQLLLSNLLESFQSAKTGNGKKLITYFSRGNMVNMAQTALNIYKDDYALSGSRKMDRKWRSSKLSAFSSNIVAILNKCKKAKEFEFNVVYYLNEEPLQSICEEGVCTWQEFEEKLKITPDVKLC